MGSQGSYGKTWAEQWDSTNNLGDDQNSYTLNMINNNNDNSSSSKKCLTKKYSKKFGESFRKTKDVASNGVDKTKESVCKGMSKVKDGASGSFSWVAHKLRKSSAK